MTEFDFLFFVGKENFLKKAFLSPRPNPSKTFKGVILEADIQNNYVVQSMSAIILNDNTKHVCCKFFAKLFFKKATKIFNTN